MGGRKLKLKDDGSVALGQRPKPGRKRVFAAAAVLTAAVAAGGCGGAGSNADPNIVIDNSWKPAAVEGSWKPKPKEEPEDKAAKPAQEFLDLIISESLEWVDAHFQSARDHRVELEPGTVTSINMGAFSIQLLPKYKEGVLEFYTITHREDSPVSFSVETYPVNPSHPFFRFYEGPKPKDAEKTGQMFIVNSFETSLFLKPDPKPVYCGALKIQGSKLHLLDSGRIPHHKRSARLLVAYDDDLNFCTVFIRFGREGAAPRVSVNQSNWEEAVKSLIESSSEQGVKREKTPFNTEYAVALHDTRDALNLFLAFSAEDPMDLVVIYSSPKLEDGSLANGDFIWVLSRVLSPDPQERLMYACTHGSLCLVKALFGKGANANVHGENGLTPLIIASASGKYEIVRYLVEEKEAELELVQVQGCTALMAAALNGKSEVVEYLLERGANPKAESEHGWTSLMFASEGGHLKVAKALVKKDKSILDLRNNAGNTALMVAAANGQLEVVEYLCGEGADPSAHNSSGWNALLGAAKAGNPELVRFLIDTAGLDPNHKTATGWTPLINAVDWKHMEIIRLLVEKGADIEARDGEGNSPLRRTISWPKNPEVAKLLVELGADVNAEDSHGNTVLYLVAVEGDPEMASYFLENGADPNKRSRYGVEMDYGNFNWVMEEPQRRGGNLEYPLICAASAGHLDLVKLLVEHGADMGAKTVDGLSALDAAKKEGHPEIAEYLESKGAE